MLPSSKLSSHPTIMTFFLWILILTITVYSSSFAQFNGLIGGTAYISPTNAQITPEHEIAWNQRSSPIAQRLPRSNATYTGRCDAVGACELFANGTLRMDQLGTTDNTTYTLITKLQNFTGTESVSLNVYATLSSPTITAVPTDHPVEGTSVNLTCNAGNQAVHYYNFVSISAIIQCDTPRVSCSPSSPVLHFNPIKVQDNGYYACVIGNPVTQNISDYLSIRVAVKVSNVTLTSNATRPITVEKDSVALICSSAGTNRSYSWTLMGSPLPQSSRYSFMDNNATLVISPVRRSDQGPFSCEVSNHLNREFSNPLNLTWSPDGQITCDVQRSGEILRLYCSWPGGYPAAQVNMAYGSNESTSLDEVISEIPHNQLPLGTVLSCTGMHEGYSEFCSVVIDTPQYPDFTNGSERAGREGSSVVLSVILSSGITGQRLQTHNTQVIPATFSWYHLDPVVLELMTGGNVSIISNDYASYLIVHHMTKDMIGRYMCKAENAIGSNSFMFVVNLTPEDSLSGGAIAGITIGSAAVLALVALTIALVCFMKKKDLRPKDEPHITTNLQGQIVTPNHYAHGQKTTGEGSGDSIYEEADGVYANCIK